MSDSSAPSTTKKASASTFGRSVVDFVTDGELIEALKTVTPQENSKNDWILPVPDPEAVEQTMEGEMKRLLNLQSFMLLDADKEEAFDQLTQEACKVFGVPTSLISLIDLGRQFLFSNTGADVRETSRAAAFCSHTILNKKGILVVNDTKEDDRFKDSTLVTQAPHLRFYAGAPLVSPEGHKLGTFCVEGPEPRPDGLTTVEKETLKEYAAKTMALMVERRKNLRDRLTNRNLCQSLKQHAGVTTDLGDILYAAGDYVTAMKFFQESVQTAMYVEEEGGQKPTEERQETLVKLLTTLSAPDAAEEKRKEAYEQLVAMHPKAEASTGKAAPSSVQTNWPIDGIPGLFQRSHSQLKGMSNAPRPLPPVVFNEAFKIALHVDPEKAVEYALDESPFTVTLDECSKATLFNMGLIQYHWGSQEMALQYFHLAASVSQKLSPTMFDPVDLGSVNNMAQIHLQFRHPEDAMKLLSEALLRGNQTLAAMYSHTDTAQDEEGEEKDKASFEAMEEDEARHTRRLRKKLARTLLNIGHVHFYSSNYESALRSCCDALPLLDRRMQATEYAAVWYNMAAVYFHQGKLDLALSYLDKFLGVAMKHLGPDHVQVADALHFKGEILWNKGDTAASLEPLGEALRIRKAKFGADNGIVAETLGLIGKAYVATKQFDQALEVLQDCLRIQHLSIASHEAEITFEIAQTLLETGRTHHAKGDLPAALEVYLKVIGWARSFFGVEHAFVGRIESMIGNIYIENGQEDAANSFLAEAKQVRSSEQ